MDKLMDGSTKKEGSCIQIKSVSCRIRKAGECWQKKYPGIWAWHNRGFLEKAAFKMDPEGRDTFDEEDRQSEPRAI